VLIGVSNCLAVGPVLCLLERLKDLALRSLNWHSPCFVQNKAEYLNTGRQAHLSRETGVVSFALLKTPSVLVELVSFELRVHLVLRNLELLRNFIVGKECELVRQNQIADFFL